MSFQLFRGQGQIQPIDLDQRLPVIDRASQRSAANYLADEGLRQAVDVAVYLGMPLLLTGEPGTGKTQLASRVAAEFSLEEPLVFETKSSSVAQDLFYSFDAVSRFALSQVRPAGDDSQARAQHAAALDPRRFVRYQALGLAILRANEIDVARQWLPAEHDFKGYVPRRSVVLIDEIDKAPRDFPNDLLNEIDRKRFRVPEIGDGHLETPDNRAPIVIITSNSERQLPDAFLRRCVYHHIDPPDDDRLIDIVCLRLPQFPKSALGRGRSGQEAVHRRVADLAGNDAGPGGGCGSAAGGAVHRGQCRVAQDLGQKSARLRGDAPATGGALWHRPVGSTLRHGHGGIG